METDIPVILKNYYGIEHIIKTGKKGFQNKIHYTDGLLGEYNFNYIMVGTHTVNETYHSNGIYETKRIYVDKNTYIILEWDYDGHLGMYTKVRNEKPIEWVNYSDYDRPMPDEAIMRQIVFLNNENDEDEEEDDE